MRYYPSVLQFDIFYNNCAIATQYIFTSNTARKHYLHTLQNICDEHIILPCLFNCYTTTSITNDCKQTFIPIT